MSGYTANSSVGRVTVGEQDTIWTPRTPRVGTCGLILLPGSGNPRAYMDNINQSASFKLAAAMSGIGIPAITCDFGGNSWANDAAMTAITNAWTTLKAAFPAMRTDKVCLIGGSMGGGAVARWSQLNPSSTACLVGLIPAYDLRYEFENIAGIAPSFRTAWGMGGADPFPAAADNAANFASAVGIPLLTGYSTVDTTVPPGPVLAYTTAVGGTAIITDSTYGHSDAAIGGMPLDTLAQFLVAHGA